MRASNLTAVYAADSGKDVPAVDNVTIEVPEGQIVGLAGESGCGKTTMGNALAMIANPPLYVVAGKMEIDDEVIDLSTLARGANEAHRPYRGSDRLAAATGRDERGQPDAEGQEPGR